VQESLPILSVHFWEPEYSELAALQLSAHGSETATALSHCVTAGAVIA